VIPKLRITLVIVTPAVPKNAFRVESFLNNACKKKSRGSGLITKDTFVFAVVELMVRQTTSGI
jgi:hypothetical protein